MIYFLYFIAWLLTLIEVFLFIYVVMSWLISFGVVNPYNAVVRAIYESMGALLEPLLRPIQRHVPMMGNLDISPLILVVLIELIKQVIIPNLVHALA